jgi:gluconate 2-dehydrogenase gamma chain
VQTTLPPTLTTLSLPEARTLDALTVRIVPGDKHDPGAREAGVLHYIDRALGGPYASYVEAYQVGLDRLDASSRERFGTQFWRTSASRQGNLVERLRLGELRHGRQRWGAEFFHLVWVHTLEGLLSDPAYGGNRDLVGWRLVGFPGLRLGFPVAEIQYGAELGEHAAWSLSDIQRLAEEEPDRFFGGGH